MRHWLVSLSVFLHGATESNNLAIFGATGVYGRRKRKIVTTSIEHPSVSECMKGWRRI